MRRQLLLLELNEVNFEYVEAYVAKGHLPNLGSLIRQHGIDRTTSEERYETLEPWIQWVTAHTGRSFSEHGIFRLGDIVNTDIPQIWEQLEEQGLKVGAISPMNAKYRLRDPAFFVPDPWTRTGMKAGRVLSNLYNGLSQAVNDNATSRLTAESARALLMGAITYARPGNYLKYAELVLRALAGPWRKAMVVDLLLADVFVREVQRTQPHFATLFLNAAAHIQHHYMFCAGPYTGQHRNPAWYISEDKDPVLETYALYDHIVGTIRRRFPLSRLMIATGLHQVPHEQATFYWRLKDHAKFLRAIGVPFARVEPRMSRDFLIQCSTRSEVELAVSRLSRAVAVDGTRMFEVDDRGQDIFVMLTYPKDIQDGFSFLIGDEKYDGLRQDVAFVALKNGEHHGVGYFIDSGQQRSDVPHHFPLKDLPTRIRAAFGLAALE
jgi:hypothetical protein